MCGRRRGRADHRGGRPGQDLPRRGTRIGRSVSGCAAGRHLWAAWTEWCWQDDADPGAGHAAAIRGGNGAGGRRRCGADPAAVRARIGLAGQYAAVDDYLTGWENVEMVGLLYGLARREARRRTTEVLDRIGLVEAAGRPVKTYSGGMRRRLDLAASLVGRPAVLFLDEPTTG